MTSRARIVGLALTLVSLLPLARAEVTAICDGAPECVLDLRELAGAIIEDVDDFIAQAAAEAAQRMDEAHDAALEAVGKGLYYGNRLSSYADDPDLIAHDCTTYTIEILKAAFDAAGMSEEIRDLVSDAAAMNGDGGLRGIDLMKLLQERFAWEGSYWNPDVRHPSDASDEHPYSAYLASKGSYYGISVDPERAITDYRPSYGSATEKDESGIAALESLPFGVLAARGGRHMAVVVYGRVYEVHWRTPPSSKDVITDEPLADWEWLSGAIVYPPGTWPDAPAEAGSEATEAAAG